MPAHLEKFVSCTPLSELRLIAACPPKEEYLNLGKLSNLSVLNVSYCSSFGNAEMQAITNMSGLKNLKVLINDGISPDSTNILASLKTCLSNCVVRFMPVSKTAVRQ